MPFLYFLEGLRNPVFDFVFSFITLFGEETIFMVVGGLLSVLAVKEFAKIVLNAILPEDSWAIMIRCFLVAITGGVLWPMTFKPLNKLARKIQNNDFWGRNICFSYPIVFARKVMLY